MSRYDHKIETSLEGIELLSKEKKENKERRDPEMSLKKIQTENQNETKEIFLKNVMLR